MAFIDTHRFGSFEASDSTVRRYVASFDYGIPEPTEGFLAHLAAGLRKETYPSACFKPTVTHRLTINFEEGDADALAASVNEAMRAIVPGATWLFQSSGASDGFTADVLSVSHSEAYHTSAHGRSYTAITFAITCARGWKGASETVTPEGAASTPAQYLLSGLKGSMPAPFVLRSTFDDDVDGVTLGFRHQDVVPQFVQDYQGTVDADATSGQAASGTMDADGVILGDGTNLDANDERGWYMLSARVEQPDATPADTTYEAVSTVTGDGIALVQSFTTDEVPASVQNAYERVLLGPLPIPAGPLPDVSAGVSGWGAEESLIDQSTDSGTATLSGTYITATEQFTGIADRLLTGVGVPVDAAPPVGSVCTFSIQMFTGVYWLTLQQWAFVTYAESENIFTLDSPVPMVAGRLYRYALQAEGDGCSIGLPYGASDPYADGSGDVSSAGVTGEPAGSYDWVFKVYGKAMRGFACEVEVNAINAGAGTAKLDTTALIPCDEFFCSVEADLGDANRGVQIEAHADGITAYVTDTADQLAALDQSLVDYLGQAQVWPGDTHLVIDAETGDGAPGGNDIEFIYTPTYLTPYGG